MTTIVSMGFSRDQALKALRATVWAAPAKDLEPMGESVGGSKVTSIPLVSRSKASVVRLKLAEALTPSLDCDSQGWCAYLTC